MGLFVLGILFGWLIEWLFFNFYWKPNHGDGASSGSRDLEQIKQQLDNKNSEIVALKSKIAAVADVKSKKAKEASKQSTVKKAATKKKAVDTGSKKKSAKKQSAGSTSAKKKTAVRKTKSVSFQKEIQKISGIGPKLASTLTASGFDSFKKLAESNPDDLKAVISKSGTKYAMIDVSSWPEQAGYLAKGDNDSFKKLLNSLKK